MDFQESAYWGCFLAEMPFLDDIWLFGGVVSRLVPAKTSSPTIIPMQNTPYTSLLLYIVHQYIDCMLRKTQELQKAIK